jgi:hypothetical protein
VLLCYEYHNGITNEEEDIIFATKLELFSIGTSTYLKQSICENHKCGENGYR